MGVSIVVGLLFFAIGIAIVVSSVVTIIRERRQIARSLPANGHVIGFETGAGRRGNLYFPVVEFKVSSGQTFRFKSSVGSSPALYSVGEPVKVIYDARQPSQAEIDSVTSLWFVPGCMLAMGIAFVALGLFLSSLMTLVLINQQ